MVFIAFLLLLSSCTTQNDWEQYPPVQDSVPVYEDVDIYHYYPGYHPRTPGMKVQPDYSSGVIQRKVPSMVPNERTMPTTRPATTTAPKTSPAPKTPRSAPKTSSTYSRPAPRPAPRPSYRPSSSSSRRRF